MIWRIIRTYADREGVIHLCPPNLRIYESRIHYCFIIFIYYKIILTLKDMLALDRLVSVFIYPLLGIMKLSTYPSPKPTFTLTSLLGQNVGLGEGYEANSTKRRCPLASRSSSISNCHPSSCIFRFLLFLLRKKLEVYEPFHHFLQLHRTRGPFLENRDNFSG